MSNVVKLDIPGRYGPPDKVLDAAKEMNLDNVLVLSQADDGSVVWLSDHEMTFAEANFLIDKFKRLLFK